MTDLDQLLQEALDNAAERVPASQDAWIRNEELLHAQQSHRGRTTLWLSTAAAAVVAILIAVMVWVVPGGGHGSAPDTGLSDAPTSSPQPSSSTPPTTTPTSPTATPSSPATATSTAPVATGPVNETADEAVRQQLLDAFQAYRSQPNHPKDMAPIPPNAIAGITAHSLYYAYEPSTDTYWALANFDATPQAQKDSDFIGFQDGGSTGTFSRVGGGPWTVTYVGTCGLTLPPDIIRLWGLPSHSDDPLCR